MHFETGHIPKDPVSGDKFQAEDNRGRRHPPVGLMDLLAKRMTGTACRGAQLGATANQPFARLDDLQVANRSLQLAPTQLTPARPECAVAELGHGDERNDASTVTDQSPGCLGVDQWSGIEQPAGDVSVDDDVSQPSSLDHASASAA